MHKMLNNRWQQLVRKVLCALCVIVAFQMIGNLSCMHIKYSILLLQKTGGAQDGEEHVEAVGEKGSMCTVCNGYFLNDRELKRHALKVHRDPAAASTGKRGSRSTVMQTSMKHQ